MTNGISHNRRRPLSLSMPATSNDPIGQLDRVVETFHQANRALVTMVLGRKERIAIGSLLAQISAALLTLTDRLSDLPHCDDRIQPHRAYPDASKGPLPPAAGNSLQNCRNGIRATHEAALALQADLKQSSCASRP